MNEAALPPAPVVRRADIERGLRHLGLAAADAVEVHSSLRSFGHVEGGAATVIEAIVDVVGPDGAIVMSAHPVTPPILLTEDDRARGLQWKVRLLPEDYPGRTGMGAVADEFRRRPDVVCGSGLHRVAAWGRDAQRHSLGYHHLLEIGGWALLLGVGIDRCTSMHYAEERAPLPPEIARVFVPPDSFLRHYPPHAWSIGYGSVPGEPWAEVWQEALRQGLVRQERIGGATCSLFRAERMVSLHEQMRRRDPYGLFGLSR